MPYPYNYYQQRVIIIKHEIAFLFQGGHCQSVADKNTLKRSLSKDRTIAARLRRGREARRLSQAEFAKQIGITRERLASYEDGRAPLRTDIALRVCRQFILSEKWLATGKGPMNSLMDLGAEPLPQSLPLDAPFSESYEYFLGKRYDKIKASQKHGVRIVFREGDNFAMMEHLFLTQLVEWLRYLPETGAHALFAFLLEFGAWFSGFALEQGRLPELKDLLTFLQSHGADAPELFVVKSTAKK